MSQIDELVEMSEKLCSSLEKASYNEKQFHTALCAEFEHQSWEIYKLANSIKEIKQLYGY